MTAILETAIRTTNAQYDDADVLNRLDVQLLDVRTHIHVQYRHVCVHVACSKLIGGISLMYMS